jgi:hypothetical protein
VNWSVVAKIKEEFVDEDVDVSDTVSELFNEGLSKTEVHNLMGDWILLKANDNWKLETKWRYELMNTLSY